MRLGAPALVLAFLPALIPVGLAAVNDRAPYGETINAGTVDRFNAVVFSGSLSAGGRMESFVKVNCDGSIWVNWPELPKAVKAGAVPMLFGMALLGRRGIVPTLSDAEQDREERDAGRALTMHDPFFRACMVRLGQLHIGTLGWGDPLKENGTNGDPDGFPGKTLPGDIWVAFDPAAGKVVVGNGTTRLFSVDRAGNAVFAGTVTQGGTP